MAELFSFDPFKELPKCSEPSIDEGEIVEFNDGEMRVIDGKHHLIVQQDGYDIDLGIYEPVKLLQTGRPPYGFSVEWKLVTESSPQTAAPEPPQHP